MPTPAVAMAMGRMAPSSKLMLIWDSGGSVVIEESVLLERAMVGVLVADGGCVSGDSLLS